MPSMASFVSRTRERIEQILTAYRMTRERDPRLPMILMASALIPLVLFAGIGFAFGAPALGIVTGIAVAMAVTLWVFGRRASGAAMSQIEGRPGAAAAVLQQMRQPWRVTPAVAYNGKQDMVHRAIGRPGIVLVGEGRSAARVTSLLRQEHRKVQRVTGETPVHEIRVGDDDGAIELGKLRMHLMRLPRSIKKGQIAELERRLASVSSQDLPIPKGPIPNMRRRPRPR